MTTNITSEFARRIVEVHRDGLPDEVIAVARKAMLNVLGLAIGASGSHGVQAVIDSRGGEIGAAGAVIPGRPERTDLLAACEATGIAAHWEDFDDGHDSLRIHPGPSALGALFVGGTQLGASLGEVLAAYAMSGEIQFRLADAIQPQNYAAGWHTTGTTGAIANSAALALLMGQPAIVLEQGLGLASCLAAGIRQGFGTMMKPMNAGKAAANGVLAALLAQEGAVGPVDALGRPGGFLHAFAEGPAVERVLDGFGNTWHFLSNTYKPYPCGRVVHPIIDAGLELRSRIREPEHLVEAIIECHPMVQTLTGIPQPSTGLETKFSAAHGLAVALVRGRAGLSEFTEDAARDPLLAAVRHRVKLQLRPADGPGTAVVTVRLTLRSGEVIESTVTAARGTLGRPLTFAEVRAKAKLLIEPVLPTRATEIAEFLESAEGAIPIARLAELTTPVEAVKRVVDAPAPKSLDNDAAPGLATSALAEFALSTIPLPDLIVDRALQWCLRTKMPSDPLGSVSPRDAGETLGRQLDDLARSIPVSAAPPWPTLRRATAFGSIQVEEESIADLVVTAALVLAEDPATRNETTVGRLIDGIGRGLEVAERVRRAFVASRPDSPWDIVAVATRLGAATTTGVMLGLDAEQLIMAYGIAGGQAGGLRIAVGERSGPLQRAVAAADGVEAALLARQGYTASTSVVEGVGGAGQTLFGTTEFPNLVVGLGEIWHMSRPVELSERAAAALINIDLAAPAGALLEQLEVVA